MKAQFKQMRKASMAAARDANGYETEEIAEEAEEGSVGGRALRRSRRNFASHTQ